ncbi:hypothetical protein B0H16DRAFT_1853810 [Mycena metata]|uniref:Uncharacterized protein n=1 Tax=Mycena metata TaxID=1033252 RepID=A0AAD7K7L7_9AGAR|nr:hypothetical protein B0H16DRAFT_1853810 [Mycena metata]
MGGVTQVGLDAAAAACRPPSRPSSGSSTSTSTYSLGVGTQVEPPLISPPSTLIKQFEVFGASVANCRGRGRAVERSPSKLCGSNLGNKRNKNSENQPRKQRSNIPAFSRCFQAKIIPESGWKRRFSKELEWVIFKFSSALQSNGPKETAEIHGPGKLKTEPSLLEVNLNQLNQSLLEFRALYQSCPWTSTRLEFKQEGFVCKQFTLCKTSMPQPQPLLVPHSLKLNIRFNSVQLLNYRDVGIFTWFKPTL